MTNTPYALTSRHTDQFTGTARIPGDKSISHRSLMLAGLAKGETLISGLLEGEDVLQTAAAMRAMGAKIIGDDSGLWRVYGVGTGRLQEPGEVLDMGNSGTSTRLLSGLIASHNITVTMTGDASLVKRPMGRIITPLTSMGAQFLARSGGRLPMTIKGAEKPQAIEYELPVASAQVKSAILLAALNTPGRTTVIERTPTRDHTEKMFAHFGVEVSVEDLGNGGQAIHIDGPQQLQPCAVDVPGDPSSAAFPAVAALLVKGSEVKLLRVGTNERRIGLYETLREMGADITFQNARIESGEPIADLVIRGTGPLRAIDVPPERVPSMIDEFPALAMAAACAEGTTRMTGLEELRVKESDRLQMVADGLKACGVKLETSQDSMTIYGTGQPPQGGALIATALDHRIAMSFLVLGLATPEPITIDDGRPIKTSFPDFIDLMKDLGAQIDAV